MIAGAPLETSRLAGYRLVTSNEGKWHEYSRLGLAVGRVSIDLLEVQAAPWEVVVRKSAAAGAMTIVEDTSLDVEGADVGVNVRWLIDGIEAHVGRRATWRVLLAVNDGTTVAVHEGLVHGRIVHPAGQGGFGFDPIFAPEGSRGATLAQIETEGGKDAVSARARAVERLLGGHPPAGSVILESLGDWDGGWQGGARHTSSP